MSSRSFLEKFPLEIVEQILDQFSHHITLPPCQTCFRVQCRCGEDPFNWTPPPPAQEWLRDLANLNRTCRRLNELTTARLYSNPTAGDNPAYFRLTRTLIARPDLGKLVRVLRVGYTSDQYTSEEVIDYILDKFMANIRAQGYEPKPREYYRARFDDELHGTLTVDVLSSLCPNVEILAGEDSLTDRLHPYGFYDPPSTAGDHAIIPAFPGEPFWSPGQLNFPNLKTVNLAHWDTEGGFGLEEFQGLLGSAASSLETMRLWELSGCSISRVPISVDARGGVVETARLEKVTQLFVDYSYINFESLLHLVELCPNVEHFGYETAGAVVSYGSGDQFTAQDVVDAVFGLVGGRGDGEGRGWKSIREVKIDMSEDYDYDGWVEEDVEKAAKVFDERGVKFTFVTSP